MLMGGFPGTVDSYGTAWRVLCTLDKGDAGTGIARASTIAVETVFVVFQCHPPSMARSTRCNYGVRRDG